MIDVFNILAPYVTNFDCISVLMLKSLLLTICFALFTGIVFFKDSQIYDLELIFFFHAVQKDLF